MRTTVRWILISVLIMDGLFAVLYFSGALTPTYAQEAVAEEATAEKPADSPLPENLAARFADNPWSQQTLEALGREMAARAEALERREADLVELERASEVLERAGIEESAPEETVREKTEAAATPAGTAEKTEPAPPPVDPAEAAASHTAFLRLQKAYENMEPDSAAQALSGLAKKDQQAVVRLLLGWNPRVSGAILDALTQTNPELAADLSYEIWKLSGGK